MLFRQNQCVTHRICAAHPKAAPTRPAGPRTQTARPPASGLPAVAGRPGQRPGQRPAAAVSLVLCLPGCAFAPCLLEAPSSHSVPGLPWVASWVPSTCQALRQLKCSVVFTSCHRSQDGFEGESVSSVQEPCVPTQRTDSLQVRWDHRSLEGARLGLTWSHPADPEEGAHWLSLPGLRWLPEVRVPNRDAHDSHRTSRFRISNILVWSKRKQSFFLPPWAEVPLGVGRLRSSGPVGGLAPGERSGHPSPS